MNPPEYANQINDFCADLLTAFKQSRTVSDNLRD